MEVKSPSIFGTSSLVASSDTMMKLLRKDCLSLSASAGRKKLSLKCDICNKSFASPQGMLVHKHRAHGAKGDRMCAVVADYHRSACNYCVSSAPKLKKHGKRVPNKSGTTRTVPTAKRGRPRRSVGTMPSSSSSSSASSSAVVRRQSEEFRIRSSATEATVVPRANIVPNVKGSEQHQNQNGGEQTENGAAAAVESDEDDDILIIETNGATEPGGNVQQQQRMDDHVNGFFSSVSPYAGVVISACAQSNLVTFHDVNTACGTIGKVTFQFMCNKCRGRRGVARCFRGRAYCVKCCGHVECD